MKKCMLSIFLFILFVSLASAIIVSSETGEVIPDHVLNNPIYQDAPADIETRDVGNWTGNGPWGGNVRSIIVDPADPMHVFAACGFNLATTVGGIYSSIDGGINWQATNLQNKPFYALANSASQAGTFYAGARNGLYRTTDNGVTWNSAGLTTAYILGIGVKPNDGNTIVIGKSGGVGIIVSTDGGVNYAPTAVTSGFMRQFAYSNANPERMFVVMGTSTASVLSSIDNGQTWSPYGPAGDGWGMYCSPTDSLFSLIAHGNGIYRTVDGGANWTIPISGTFRSVVEYNGVFYATSNAGGVFESIDQGLNWQNYNTGIVQSTWQTAASSGAGALLGCWGGIFRGVGYQVPIVVSHTGMNAAFVHGLAYYSDTNELWAGSEGSGLYRSTDSGTTWDQMVNGLNSWMIYELVPTNHQFYQSGRMLAGTLNGVYTSIDGGANWTFVDYATNQCTALEVHPTNPRIFWIGTSAGEIKRTDDGGQNWTVATGGQFGFAPRLKLGRGPTGELRLFLSYQGSATAIWYSDDLGTTFAASTGMEATTYQTMVAVRPELGWQTQLVYAASDLGIYKSTDHGATFTLSGLTGFSWSVMSSPGMQVVSGKENGVGYSTDEATTSSSLSQNLVTTTIWQMAWGTNTNQVFIATKGKGIFENRFTDTNYGTPANLIAVPGDQQVTLSWTPVSTTPLPTSYHIWRDGYPVHTATDGQPVWTDSNLINGQDYRYFVSAVYEGNIETSPTEIITVTPIAGVYPPPTNLQATVQNENVVHLTWQAPAGTPPNAYRIFRNGETAVTIDNPPETNYFDILNAAGSYTYYVTAVYAGGESLPSNEVTVVIVSNEDPITPIFTNNIMGIHPNPFSVNTTIKYQIASKQMVEIRVFNILGQRIQTLLTDIKQAGAYQANWDGCDASGNEVPSGVYFISLKTGEKIVTRKAMLVK